MKKKEFWIFAAFALIIIAFFWDLAILKHAFLSGDHREQQYPWAKFYQEQIRQFRLPWWAADFHCGFPLLAEGQIGAFYPLNYLFFLLLPVKIAYNYIILFQYWLGAVLFYIYLRSLRISIYASFFASLIFLFGSTQGGYFYYNYISQKVVIWLPLTLILIDRLVQNKRWQDSFWLGVVFAVQIFGGYLQVAIYSVLYSSIYFLYRWWSHKDRKVFLLFAGAGLLGILFSLVQLMPTLELSLLSSRASAEKGLAYVGSMNPAGFITLLYPSWDGLLGSELYVGTLSLFFILVVLLTRRSKDENFFLSVTVFFLLLALGKFSPLYRLLVEGTGFNSFRTPIKFLFFVSFSLIALTAFGLDKFFKHDTDRKLVRLTAVIFGALLFISLLVPSVASWTLKHYESRFLPKFQSIIVKNYHGKAGHPYSIDFYRDKAANFYSELIQTLSPRTLHTRIEMSLLFLMLLICSALWKFPLTRRRLVMFLFIIFLFFDLYLYAFTSIRGNEEAFNTIDMPHHSHIVDYLKHDKSIYRVMEVYTRAEDNRAFPLFPSFNMLDHIPDIGAYSPLVMKYYKNYLDGWGYINDSLSIHLVDPMKLKEHIQDLNILNVKYLLSLTPLDLPGFEMVMEDKNVFLYHNLYVLPRAFFIPENITLQTASILNITPAISSEYGDSQSKFTVEAFSSGQLFVSDILYNGWTAKVDGKTETMIPSGTYGLFRSMKITRGSHTVKMEYSNKNFKTYGWFALTVFLLGSLQILISRKRKGSLA